jgi:hypothetical protein
MAKDDQNIGGLSGTMENIAKLPLYGTTDDQLQELKKSTQDALSALEQRYAQPNWFKVAAGFAKPQLGGFLASLGSASEAMGENVEQQRAQMLPIAQMRAQLAQTNLLLGKNKAVTDKIEAWKAANPGRMPSSAQLMEWRAEAPGSPAVQSLIEQQKTGIEQQGQTLQLLQRNEENLKAQVAAGLISADEYKRRTQENRRLIDQLLPPVPMEGAASQSTAAPQQAPAAPQPSAEAGKETAKTINGKDISNFEIKNSFALPHNMPKDLLTAQQVIENEAVIKNAEAVEAAKRAQYINLQKLNDPLVIGVAQNSINALKDAFRTNPEMIQDITNQVRKLGAAGSAAQAGIAVNWGPMGASISLPVEAAARGNLSQTQQNYQDAFINNLATVAYYGLLSRGISPESAGADKFRQLLLQETGISQGAKAIAHQVDLNEAHLKHAQNLYTSIRDAIPSATASRSPAPFYEIDTQHPGPRLESRKYQATLDYLNKSFEKSMREAREKEKRGAKP